MIARCPGGSAALRRLHLTPASPCPRSRDRLAGPVRASCPPRRPPASTWTEAENEAADRQLEMAVGDWDCWYFRLTGYSPDTGHAEPGWAADLSAEAGLELGRTFLQDAIYMVEDGELWVLDCDSPIVREYVGPFAERLDRN
ncbi:MAG: DUF3293 domain-containing protein [Gammaproteobacteria bacterium]|nr:DUF3293 domain-containing protein [Gammaproteobacteria bacterium]